MRETPMQDAATDPSRPTGLDLLAAPVAGALD
jgi:hypothetical protein